MNRQGRENWDLLAIAAITVISGLVQVVMPGGLLRLLSAENTPTGRHFFGTIGMFMVVVGGGSLTALSRDGDPRGVVFWTGVQKLGASAAVALGVKRGVFSPLALLVASFDFLSAILFLRSLARWSSSRADWKTNR